MKGKADGREIGIRKRDRREEGRGKGAAENGGAPLRSFVPQSSATKKHGASEVELRG